MKKFLKGGEAKNYPAVEIQWIPGHSPEAEFLNIRREVVRRVDLAPLSTQAIRDLLKGYGIVEGGAAPKYQ